jgi:hypothetical protein
VRDVSIGSARRDQLPRILERLEEGGLPRDGLANRLSTTLLAYGSWDARLWSSTDVWPCCVR